MGSSLDMVKTLIIPAFISLSIYLLLSYILLPLFRRYHQRYANYLPITSGAISAQTLPIRERIADSLMHFFLPTASWRRRLVPRFMRSTTDENYEDDDDESIDRNRPDNHASIDIFDEEGENMAEMNMSASRREALEARRSFGGMMGGAEQVRLSRDLEEGFMDDSDDEEESLQGLQGRR